MKEGCRIEALQLGSAERIETALALYLVVAWRVNRLMRLGRSLPELPADLLFETEEWQAAYILNKKPVPKKTPDLNSVVRLIAQLGGFLGRKGDGEPGAKTLWLGLRDIAVFVQVCALPGSSYELCVMGWTQGAEHTLPCMKCIGCGGLI